MRKTKIICTIGPAVESEEKIRELILAGMDEARFNFSHGDHAQHKRNKLRVEKLRKELGLPVATLLDTKGPEIRVCDFENGRIELEAGQRFTLTTESVMGNNEKVSITLACKMSIKAGDVITMPDMIYLINELRHTKNPFTCPHGRPTIIAYTKYDLEKLFKRAM